VSFGWREQLIAANMHNWSPVVLLCRPRTSLIDAPPLALAEMHVTALTSEIEPVRFSVPPIGRMQRAADRRGGGTQRSITTLADCCGSCCSCCCLGCGCGDCQTANVIRQRRTRPSSGRGAQ